MKPYKKKRLHIKNMAHPGCIKTVHEQALKAGLQVKTVKLGKLTLEERITEEQLNVLAEGLSKHGFEIITDKFIRLIESVKIEIIKIIHHGKKLPANQTYSTYLPFVLGREYNYLNGLFMRLEKTTIEKYILQQKIEKAKKLLCENELPLKEIAERLGFSNTQHLIAQFKKITGLGPYQFKEQLQKSGKILN